MRSPLRSEEGGFTFGATPRREAYVWIGLALPTLLLFQSALGWKWPWLATLQTHKLYLQLSGVALALLFARQWRLAACRSKGAPPAIGRVLASHKLWGAAFPLFFYCHARNWGYGYTALLSAVALAIFGTGLLHAQVARLRRKRLLGCWIIGHVALSAALIFLVAYHVFITLRYG